MSLLSSWKAESGTQDATRDAHQNRSDTNVTLLLRRAGDIVQPVSIAKALLPYGISLRKAHEVVNRLTANEVPAIGIPVSLVAVSDIDQLTSRLVALGLEATPLRRQDAAGEALPRLREQLRLTQDEFALLLDVELATLRNWEQKRTVVSGGPLGIIVNLLMRRPEAVILGRIASAPVAPNDRQVQPASPQV